MSVCANGEMASTYLAAAFLPLPELVVEQREWVVEQWVEAPHLLLLVQLAVLLRLRRLREPLVDPQHQT